MAETDLILMSLLIFVPGAFGLALTLFPSGRDEWMRWWALFGSAGALILSMCMLIDFYAMLDSRLDPGGRPLHSRLTQLDARSDAALAAQNAPLPRPRLSNDFIARIPWIERFGINYALGADGLSMALILLTTIVMFLSVIASWKITENVRGYFMLLLILETGVIGAFLAIDLFLFYVFYELMLIPMYFLIGIWGGERRKRAAFKFVVYTLFGSVFILVSLVALYLTNVRDFVDPAIVDAKAEQILYENPTLTPEAARERVVVHTFDIVTLQKAGQAASLVRKGQIDRLTDAAGAKLDSTKVPLLGSANDRAGLEKRLQQPFFRSTLQYFLFILLFLGFAVKIPIVPLHSWLPDAHVEAPTPVSMILAGVLLKLGGYGLFRIVYPICPYAAYQMAWWIALIGVIGIVYGALVAMGQSDFKKLLAYSSISHMGYVVLGLAAWSSTADAQYWAWGANGAAFQMIAHGITSAGMFFIVGVIYDRAHHRELSKFGGLMEPMPKYSGMSAILFFASMALPGLCGFVGELFVMISAWHFSPVLAIISIVTTILTAGYLLWAWQRVFLGTNPATKEFKDVSLREVLCLLPFVVLAIALGVIPSPLLINWMEPSITGMVEQLARL